MNSEGIGVLLPYMFCNVSIFQRKAHSHLHQLLEYEVEMDMLKNTKEYLTARLVACRQTTYRLETLPNNTPSKVSYRHNHHQWRIWDVAREHGPKCLHFHAVFGKQWSNSMLASPSGKSWIRHCVSSKTHTDYSFEANFYEMTLFQLPGKCSRQ